MTQTTKRNKIGWLLLAAALLVIFLAALFPPDQQPSTPAPSAAAAEAESDWALLLVNKDHPIPERYTVDLHTLANGQAVDARIYPALQELFDAARAEGIYPVVVAGYRTSAKQQRIMDERIQEYMEDGATREEAAALAQEWVAPVGTSEHQLGLAVDINPDTVSTADEVYTWLAENAHTYGFIQRYPEDKVELTGIGNEPWHYRYVGKAAAQEMFDQKLCLEEYLQQQSSQP